LTFYSQNDEKRYWEVLVEEHVGYLLYVQDQEAVLEGKIDLLLLEKAVYRRRAMNEWINQ